MKSDSIERIARALYREGVAYVVVGALAVARPQDLTDVAELRRTKSASGEAQVMGVNVAPSSASKPTSWPTLN